MGGKQHAKIAPLSAPMGPSPTNLGGAPALAEPDAAMIARLSASTATGESGVVMERPRGESIVARLRASPTTGANHDVPRTHCLTNILSGSDLILFRRIRQGYGRRLAQQSVLHHPHPPGPAWKAALPPFVSNCRRRRYGEAIFPSRPHASRPACPSGKLSGG